MYTISARKHDFTLCFCKLFKNSFLINYFKKVHMETSCLQQKYTIISAFRKPYTFLDSL